MKDQDIILKAENISKQYRLGLVGTGTLSHDLNRWWSKIRGKEDPYLKVGEVNDRSSKGSSQYVWALKDINFEVKRGEVLGIIGKNGAGKSTLLKILSKVTSPTTGEIKTKGRIASLLEVGTGFHGEMTGRENIYLNGAILGMTKKEINLKIDEIIEFSGCQRYIDTPVKRYSSGMTVRLAFAVAAFLEPEILVIDEVLAVGDAEFQKKAIGKMQDISRGQGRTVLFVSHNMSAIKTLCTRGIVLEHGNIVFEGGSHESVEYYSKLSSSNSYVEAIHESYGDIISELNFEISRGNIKPDASFFIGDDMFFRLGFKVSSKMKNILISFNVLNYNNELISHISNEDSNYILNIEEVNSSVEICIKTDKILYIPGRYKLNLWIGDSKSNTLYTVENIFNFIIEQGNYTKRVRPLPKHSKVYLHSNWE
ncbi:ABC transporter ATP-binding protein [Sabulilitoribacter arenilitoris]|uniref:ABC transporter ATP-binding protein n=1 Tax=Wocania arenilitoris TaxID=2044858 RepID=A0AAE3ERX3_9FLAO|nr:ABC transporter ATP-binding protein [Wocania arenilitoris]MCF7568950.1 ABC transporter ATP-binding protein [Wocania arenilitoris]